MSDSPSAAAEPTLPARRRWRPAYIAMYVVYLAVLIFGGLELFWRLRVGSSVVKPAGPEAVWSLHYREMDQEGVLDLNPSLTDDRFDVLLLGGSVMEQTKDDLRKEFEARIDQPVHLCNLARAGKSSKDSQIKYRRIRDKQFDLVLVYNGINDLPQNYIPPEKFRVDYSHCGWFSTFERRLESGQLVITDLADDLKVIGTARPRAKYFEFGSTVKTDRSVAENLRYIVEHAHKAGSQTLLMTFAWHLPEDYSPERLKAGELDYGKGSYHMEAESWGRPEHIPTIMQAQNDAIRKLAAELNVALVDQTEVLNRGEHFCDVCHLTPLGCQVFAKHTVDAVLRDRENRNTSSGE